MLCCTARHWSSGFARAYVVVPCNACEATSATDAVRTTLTGLVGRLIASVSVLVVGGTTKRDDVSDPYKTLRTQPLTVNRPSPNLPRLDFMGSTSWKQALGKKSMVLLAGSKSASNPPARKTPSSSMPL